MAVTATDTLKRCAKCGAVKPRAEFHRNRQQKDGRHPQCAECKSAQARANHRANYDAEAQRWRQIKHRYGITREDYWNLYRAQAGCCAICRRDESAVSRGNFFCVDHDHYTGKVRGLLCTECNLAVGYVEATGARPSDLHAYLGGDDLSR